MKTLIGEQIRKIREMHNVTQEQMAELLKMTRQRFARIEKGISDISYDTIITIANYLNIDPKEITDVCANSSSPVTTYRTGTASADTFCFVEEMIGFFYANKSLYKRMNMENSDEL